ncbi:hypothetical protein ACH5RR_027442 [Cinchona calisaya]|uniref:Uncharacterized protein n=1 Tax=Cinchona calisaya TaxID=153742 RepID=A0ABD2Z8V3_9GENT
MIQTGDRLITEINMAKSIERLVICMAMMILVMTTTTADARASSSSMFRVSAAEKPLKEELQNQQTTPITEMQDYGGGSTPNVGKGSSAAPVPHAAPIV